MPPAVRLNLLSGFELLVDGARVDVPSSAQRVVAYLGLGGRPQPRTAVAASLWQAIPEQRASANLRGALWKLHGLKHRLVATHADRLSLRQEVVIDVAETVREARRLLAGRPAEEAPPPAELVDRLSRDVLPDWDEDWIVFERERVRQLRIHAMEALSSQLREVGRLGEAVEAGMSAVAADPLRESAQRVLVEAHLAEGNTAQAWRQLESFRSLLGAELGVTPSAGLVALVAGAAQPTAATGRAVPAVSIASRSGGTLAQGSVPSRTR